LDTGLKPITNDERRALIDETVRLLHQEFGEDLVSIVLFGSVARGEETDESDADLLIVSRSFPESLTDRMDRLTKILIELEKTQQHKKMREKGINTWIQFHPLRTEEAKLHRPIYLDMVEDGIIIYDKEGFIKKILSSLKRNLEKMGARRIFLKDGSWYWDLKPDIRKGEIIEV